MFETLLTPDALQSYYLFAGFTLPVWPRIFARTGLNRYYAGLVLLPYSGMFVIMGLLAFKRWPNEPVKPKKESK